MVIEFNINSLVEPGEENLLYCPGPGAFLKISGEIGEWLVEHGHNGEIIPELQLRTILVDHYIQFDDPKVAMLFKLTWL